MHGRSIYQGATHRATPSSGRISAAQEIKATKVHFLIQLPASCEQSFPNHSQVPYMGLRRYVYISSLAIQTSSEAY